MKIVGILALILSSTANAATYNSLSCKASLNDWNKEQIAEVEPGHGVNMHMQFIPKNIKVSIAASENGIDSIRMEDGDSGISYVSFAEHQAEVYYVEPNFQAAMLNLPQGQARVECHLK